MNLKIIIGAVTILIGLLLLSNVVGLQIINDGTPTPPKASIIDMYPKGTEAVPDTVTPGQSVDLQLKAMTARTQTGYQYWVVSAKFEPDTTLVQPQTVTLPFSVDYLPNGLPVTFAQYRASWTVPLEAGGVTYKVSWEVWNSAHTVRYAANTSYCRVASADPGDPPVGQPDGTFMLNGFVANEDTDIIVKDGKLTFAFVPSTDADEIDRVYIEVLSGGKKISTVQLSASGSSYTASYTLPEPGFYVMNGFVKAKSGSVFSRLSVVADLQEEGGEPTDPLDEYAEDARGIGTSHYAGAGLIVVGFAVIVLGRRK